MLLHLSSHISFILSEIDSIKPSLKWFSEKNDIKDGICVTDFLYTTIIEHVHKEREVRNGGTINGAVQFTHEDGKVVEDPLEKYDHPEDSAEDNNSLFGENPKEEVGGGVREVSATNINHSSNQDCSSDENSELPRIDEDKGLQSSSLKSKKSQKYKAKICKKYAAMVSKVLKEANIHFSNSSSQDEDAKPNKRKKKRSNLLKENISSFSEDSSSDLSLSRISSPNPNVIDEPFREEKEDKNLQNCNNFIDGISSSSELDQDAKEDEYLTSTEDSSFELIQKINPLKKENTRLPMYGSSSSVCSLSPERLADEVCNTGGLTAESGSGKKNACEKNSKSSKLRKKRLLKKKRSKRKRCFLAENDDSSAAERCESGSEGERLDNVETRKKIRKIKSSLELEMRSKQAILHEEERKKRINSKLNENIACAEKKGSVVEVILDSDKSTKGDLATTMISIPKELVEVSKPYQFDGIRFLYDNLIEDCVKCRDEEGSGCILAHSMGLGKSFQMITFILTLYSYPTFFSHLRAILLLCPINTIMNWKSECSRWSELLAARRPDSIPNVYNFSEIKSTGNKLEVLKNWKQDGGIMLMGYDIFRVMLQKRKVKKKKKFADIFKEYLLDPGPDVVICDEGHILKSYKSQLFNVAIQIRSKRRVILTGTPLQNNLIEYHTMVEFVKPNLLGTLKEFRNRFVNPIENGQHADSTEYDVKQMKKRSHILFKMLSACVQRKSFLELKPYLSTKFEYVILVRLTNKQYEMLKEYYENLKNKCKGGLFSSYYLISLVSVHPWLLRLNKIRQLLSEKHVTSGEEERGYGSEDLNPESTSIPAKSKAADDDESIEVCEIEQICAKTSICEKHLSDDKFEFDYTLSYKILLLKEIIEYCEKIGDKLLIFTNSLLVLDYIENMLDQLHQSQEKTYLRDLDYLRLDGSSSFCNRHIYNEKFNCSNNTRLRIFLLSTKAGSLGINLVGANRVVVMDASWNPTHDQQAIFRVFRLGQKKCVYIYRFISQGTMEERVYDRQVNKQSLSKRVIDAHQITRHVTSQELTKLFTFDPCVRDGDIQNSSKYPAPPKPSDGLLTHLLKKNRHCFVSYHQHDSLLENRLDENLTEEDQKKAWEEFQYEKKYADTGAVFKNATLSLDYIMHLSKLFTDPKTCEVKVSQLFMMLMNTFYHSHSVLSILNLMKEAFPNCSISLLNNLNRSSYNNGEASTSLPKLNILHSSNSLTRDKFSEIITIDDDTDL